MQDPFKFDLFDIIRNSKAFDIALKWNLSN